MHESILPECAWLQAPSWKVTWSTYLIVQTNKIFLDFKAEEERSVGNRRLVFHCEVCEREENMIVNVCDAQENRDLCQVWVLSQLCQSNGNLIYFIPFSRNHKWHSLLINCFLWSLIVLQRSCLAFYFRFQSVAAVSCILSSSLTEQRTVNNS